MHVVLHSWLQGRLKTRAHVRTKYRVTSLTSSLNWPAQTMHSESDAQWKVSFGCIGFLAQAKMLIERDLGLTGKRQSELTHNWESFRMLLHHETHHCPFPHVALPPERVLNTCWKWWQTAFVNRIVQRRNNNWTQLHHLHAYVCKFFILPKIC